tara:strand:- start:4 stop:1443 length:1440 start_codon:yes stop_codon:yes gene_type:complete
MDLDIPAFIGLFSGGGIEGVRNPDNCADREPYELDRRAACRDGTLTGEPGVIIPNPYDPCNFGGECISGPELINYCSSGNNKLQRGCVEYGIKFGINWDDMEPGTNPSGGCPSGEARNAEGECENREEFRARCQEGGGLVIAPTDTGGAGKGGGGRGGASVGPETHLGTCLTNEEAYTWCNQQAADNDPSVPAHPRCAEVISIYESDNGGGDDDIIDDNNGNGLDDDFDINCNLINKQDGDEPGTCGPCLPGYKLDNTKLSPFEGITPCVKIEERKEEDPNCVEQNRETEDNGFCGNCKPGFSPDLREGSATHDQCIPNNITLGTDDDDDDNDDNTDVDNDDDTNVDNDDDVDDVDNVDDVDDDDDDTDTTFDCASVGKLPPLVGILPTSEEGCGPCLPTHNRNPDGSCSPKVNGGDNDTDPGIDPGLGTVAGAGTGSITQGMFKKYIPEFQPINSELLGRAPAYSSGMNMEGLFKGFF